MFISIGVIAHSAPNYSIAILGSIRGLVNVISITLDTNGVYPPIIYNTALPDLENFIGSIVGLM